MPCSATTQHSSCARQAAPAGRPGRALELFGGAFAVLGKHQAARGKAPGHDHAHHLRAGAW
jgi:hypothetical protein